MKIYSREYLQSLPEIRRQGEINQHICVIVNQIKEQVYVAAEQGKTALLYDAKRLHMKGAFGMPNFPSNEQLLQVIRENFPGCNVDYVEVKLTNGNIAEAGFKIDWS